MEKVCPFPLIWNEIYKSLYQKWIECSSIGEAPPVPLILGGWVYSNDVEKQKRWKETEKWAQGRGFSSILLDLTEENFYKVDELSD
jgi:hypothetical protein